MKIIFWLLVAGDSLALLLLFLLGLAAAPSSRTSPLTIAATMLLVPLVVLALAILLFVRVNTPLARAGATLLVALPLVLVVGLKSVQSARMKAATGADGSFRFFSAGPARDILDAIDRNDAATITRLAPQVDLNARGMADMTLLMYAVRRLEQAPHALEPLRALLGAGADPNQKADELPLEVAIQQGRHAGAEPVAILLGAGADPNVRNQFGEPVFFMGTGITVPLEVLDTLLNHGADLALRDRDSLTVVFSAARAHNWPAVLRLLERGTDYHQGRTINGETFVDFVESQARVFGDSAAGLPQVLDYLHRHGS